MAWAKEPASTRAPPSSIPRPSLAATERRATTRRQSGVKRRSRSGPSCVSLSSNRRGARAHQNFLPVAVDSREDTIANLERRRAAVRNVVRLHPGVEEKDLAAETGEDPLASGNRMRDDDRTRVLGGENLVQ